MKRVLPVLALTVAGLIPVWRYAPSHDTGTTVEAAPAPAPSSTAAGGSTVFTGPTVDTEKGPVQVEVTFDGDRISAVRMLQQPDHPQTEAAVPTLIEETLSAQSSDIDTVSGATLTSDAYRESLQAVLDEQAAAGADAPAADAPAGDSSGEPADEPAAEPEPVSETLAGPTVNTEKGPVQVEVTFDGDTIGAVRMLQQPNHPQTIAAVPQLIEDTLDAQSADIDTVSGATLTSDAYKQSLQAVLDAKGV
ncbi:FMN-binding protein [Streptomyces sp. NPDC093252]|uniref:FMN-binding protein n=1 Tax=Streptomyces sp. NPDC093252 TaxID=3154980 RepID=UPI00344A3F89